MVGVTFEVDRAAVADLNALLKRVAKESPKRLATETRRAALYICQGLRKRTKKAPKKVRKNEYIAVPSPNPPRYVVNKNSPGYRRRWAFTRKAGTPDAYTIHRYVPTDAMPNKSGKMVGKKQAAERRYLVDKYGQITRHGLAKKSWGWVAKEIYSASNMGDLSWKRSAGERRDPRKAVKGVFQKEATGAAARILNKLDYILAAVSPAQVSEAVTAARKRLEHNIEKRIERIAKK